MSEHQKTLFAIGNVEAGQIRSQLDILRMWLGKQKHINACTEEESMFYFLHDAKYDLDRCKKKIARYYQMRAERVEWFQDRDPFQPEVQALLALGVFLPIDGVDSEQRKVVVIRTAAHDPKLHTQNNVFKVGMMVLDLLMKLEPEHCARGIVAIFDMNGVKLGHAMQMTPKLIKHSVDSWQTYPCQPKRLEFCNAPPHVNVVLNTFRLFMTAKMRSRIVVTRKGCSMGFSNLPQNIGGTGDTYDDLAIKWKHLVEQNVAFYAQYDQYKSYPKEN